MCIPTTQYVEQTGFTNSNLPLHPFEDTNVLACFLAAGSGPEAGLLVSFDGACRGNPGLSASGVCVLGGAFASL